MHPFTKDFRASVSALGEEKLIAAIRRWLGAASPRAPFGIGDDCAVLRPSRGRQLITVDPVIYPRHFNDRVPPRAVGEKLLKRNLSDLAAMGGRPTAAVLALTLDARVSLAWLEQFYRGLAACATLLVATAALSQAAPAPAVQVRGCVIDADHYAPIGVPVSAYLVDGVALDTTRSDGSGRFTLTVPASARVYVMTGSGPRSVHSRATVDTAGRTKMKSLRK